jgi:hypothetical protein
MNNINNEIVNTITNQLHNLITPEKNEKIVFNKVNDQTLRVSFARFYSDSIGFQATNIDIKYNIGTDSYDIKSDYFSTKMMKNQSLVRIPLFSGTDIYCDMLSEIVNNIILENFKN